jgi:hypothetical protein
MWFPTPLHNLPSVTLRNLNVCYSVQTQKSQPKDELVDEELMPYLMVRYSYRNGYF